MRLFALALGLAMAAPLTAEPATTVETLLDFESEVSPAPITSFGFDMDVGNAVSHDFGAFTTTMQNPDFGTVHRVVGGQLLFALNGPPVPQNTQLVMEFDTPVYGLGFDPVGIDFIDISIDGGATFFDIAWVAGISVDGFFAVADVANPFTSVIFEINGPEVGDGGFIDNLVYASAPAAVPLPASVLLLGGGLAGLAVMRRRRT